MAEGGFFGFRTLVTNTIIKTVYALGAAAITLAGVAFAAFPFLVGLTPDQDRTAAGIRGLALGLVIFVGGNLLWRLLCEGWIILFSIHEMLASVERRLNQGEELAAQSRLIAELLRATEANTEQRHEELLAALRAASNDPDRTIIAGKRG